MPLPWESLISRHELLKLYCCDPFKLYKKRTSKGLHKTDNEVTAMLNIKPSQKLCRNCMTKTTEVTEL